MELSQNYEFLAAALTAITGDLVLDTPVPGDNTKIPERYNIKHLWNGEKENSFDLETLCERVLTYYCPPKDENTEGPPLYIRTMTGVTIKLFIDRSNTVLCLKKKIQEEIDIHPDQQRLLPYGWFNFSTMGSAFLEQDSDFFLKDLWPISKFKFKDNTIILEVFGGKPPSAQLLDKDIFDTTKNCDFTWLHDDKTYMRGNFVYKRPYGWNRIAFDVEDKYFDNSWYGDDPGHGYQNYRESGLKDEWPVSYHGSKDKLYNMLKLADSNNEGRLAKGFYSCPDPKVAEESASVFSFKSREFKVMIQSRVNMNDTAIVGDQKFYSTTNLENIRTIGLLIKSVD